MTQGSDHDVTTYCTRWLFPMSRRVFRIGCAGWTLPRAHAAAFPREGSHLQRYAAVFGAVEINSSFYRPHRRETYMRWASSVPSKFRFSVKMPKQITHTQRLRRSARMLDEFLEQIGGLGRRLGAVLVQLPPSLAFERAVAKRFFGQLRDRFDGNVVIEPRHATWFEERAHRVLCDFFIGRVAADPALSDAAALPAGDARFVYFRLHGSPRIYFSSYDDAFLETIAERMQASVPGAREVWCMFDNTAHGHAVPNALHLSELLNLAPATRRPHS
jgi:uncharacterized protein YecE (DUF72 family)